MTALANSNSSKENTGKPSLLVGYASPDKLNIIHSGANAGFDIHSLQTLNNDEILSKLKVSEADILVLQAWEYTETLHSVVKQVLETNFMPVAVFVEACDPELLHRAIATGIGALIIGGLKEDRIENILRLATARHKTILDLANKLDTLEIELADRKSIERAKGLLMEKRQITEKEAYETIRRLSMSKGKPMREIAISMLDFSDIL